ncbi:MAG: NIF family HAD-type phosphatase [Planctomycetota bacterium]
MTRRRIAIDLDDTLGTAVVDAFDVIGFTLRPGCIELLADLAQHYELVLFTAAPRRYVEKVFAFTGLGEWFAEQVTADEWPYGLKDPRFARAEFLVDDLDDHRRFGIEQGIGSQYIIIPAFGSPDDEREPDRWSRIVRDLLLPR